MKTLLLAALCLVTVTTHAAVKPHGLFSNGAVLQQGMEVPIWGTASDGEKVTVKFQGQEVSTVAKDGRWQVKLKPLQPGGPFTLTINELEITDVLVGEVWLCSGQSNMAFTLTGTSNAKAAILASTDPLLRCLTLSAAFKDQPETGVTASWRDSNPVHAANFTAVGYFFGRDLRKALNVPVGLIHSSVGGTPAQAWTSPAALRAGGFHTFFEAHEKSVADYTARLTRYKTDLENWKAEAASARTDGRPEPKEPKPPGSPTGRGPGCLYNGMIAPLVPYALRGAIWYQGEANAGNPTQYQSLLPTLIQDWRTAWGQGDFPFLFVQIAPYNGIPPELREAQLRVWQTTTNTAMAVITDCGSPTNIHPKDKEPVGQRLALAARATVYGEKIEFSGPLYDSMKVTGAEITLTFRHTGTGLVAKDGDLKGFMIAGPDKKFTSATARIDGTKVIVSHATVTNPVAVRYGWANTPDVNLYNKEGLPASPFRTDRP